MLVIETEPEVEPITVEEAKAHARVDLSDDDALIEEYLTAARRYCEIYCNRAFITQTWRWVIDDFPAAVVKLPLTPVQSLVEVTYMDTDGVVNEFAEVAVDPANGTLMKNPAYGWPSVSLMPSGGVRIEFVAGYGDEPEDVPDGIRLAIKHLTAHWYENREPIVTGTVTRYMPVSFQNLLWQYKDWT